MTIEELMKENNVDPMRVEKARKRLQKYMTRYEKQEKLKKQVMGFCESLMAKPKTVDWRPVAA